MQRIPPESQSIDKITIRRWRADDVGPLHEMVLSSLDHLRPWMPWVRDEPLTFAERAEKVEAWERNWDAALDFTYAIVNHAGSLLGVCGLHRCSDADALEIGFWVRSERTGEGTATNAARALVHAAFSIEEISCIEIHHDAANVASSRVPAKVGFIRVSERPEEPLAAGEVGVDVTWRLRRSDFPEFEGTPPKSVRRASTVRAWPMM